MVAKINKIIILVHGAWHGAWCWEKVAKELRLGGYNVIALDLPGHAENSTSISDINLQSYIDYVQQHVLCQDQQVVLVGHSMAGIVISQVAENIPHKIDKLVYVAAYLPENNGSLIDEGRQASTQGISVVLTTDLENNQIRLSKSEILKTLFYNCCSDEDAELAISKLNEAEPLNPFTDTLKLSPENFGEVKKLYIECLQDNAITIEQQRRMHKKYQTEVVTLNSDHSPFISCVEELTKAIFS